MSEISIIKGSNLPIMPSEDRVLDKVRLFGYTGDQPEDFETVQIKGSDIQKEIDNTVSNTSGYADFSEEEDYFDGQVVNRNGKLYKFTEDHPAGPWNPGQVEPWSLEAEISETNEQVAKIKEDYAQKKGVYPNLTAGNLVGHGSVSAEYTFRTSGGTEDIGTGAATIDVLKGKTLKLQQIVPITYAGGTSYDVTCTNNNDGSFTVNGTASETANFIIGSFNRVVQHKYLLRIKGNTNVIFQLSEQSKWNVIPVTDKATIITATETGNSNIVLSVNSGYTADNEKVYATLFDLTEMGLDSITSVAEFEALYPLDYYDYTAIPVLKNNAASGIVTTGLNQWDEEWEVGYINDATGQNQQDDNKIRSKNYIPVFEKEYYFQVGAKKAFVILGYDANKNFVSLLKYVSNYNGWSFEVPSGVRFIRFASQSDAYGNTYLNDICINFSWSGYRNGEYEPYEKHTLYFNGENGSLATVTGKKLVSGVPTGESEIVWVDGMKGIGTAFDFGKVDSDGYIHVGNRVIGVRDYEAGDESDATVITDGSTTTYYVLDTPEEYLLDTPIPANYIVNDFGTEQRIPEDTASSVMAPIAYEVSYASNVPDTVRNLPRNYVSINAQASDDSTLKALATALSTALGIEITWTWDESTRTYTFTVADNRAFKVVEVPAAADATGTAGNIAFDTDYLYVCVATDTWMRAALSTWS